MIQNYDHNQHSVYLLYYHLIMVVKYRRKVIRNEISDRGCEIFEKISYKNASSRLLKKEFPVIRQKLWKEAFWSKSYMLLTTGGAPTEVIRQYIESQGEHL